MNGGTDREPRSVERELAAYHHLFEQVDAGYVLLEVQFDPDGNPYDYRFLETNAAFLRIFGWMHDAVIGHTLGELIPDAVPAWTTAYTDILSTGRPTRLSHYAIGLDRHLLATVCSPGEARIAALVSDVTAARRAEAAVSESERRARQQAAELALIYRTVPIGLCVVDTELRFVHVNACLAEINGVPAEAHLGRTVREVVPSLADRIEPMLRRVLDTGEPVLGLESSGETPAQPGIQRHWLSQYWPLCNEQGQVYAINVVAEEITERKRTEEAVRREQAFRTLAENSPDVVVRFDRQLRRVYANPAIEALLGRPCREAIGKTNRELGMPEPLAAFLDAQIREAFDSGHASRFEVRFPSPAGERFLESHMVPEPGPGGAIETVLAISRDITDRRHAEEALRASEIRYRELVDNLYEGIWLIDREHRTSFVNHRTAELLGYETDEMLGRSVFDFMAPDATETAERNLERGRTGVRAEYEFEFRRKSGEPIPTRIMTTPLFDEEGAYKGALAGVVDITERKRTEDALRESEQRLRLANEAASIGAWSFEPASRGIDFDATTRYHWGFSCDEPLAFESVYSRVLPDDRPAVDRSIAAIGSGSEVFAVELRVRHPDGSVRQLRAVGRPMPDSHGRVIRIVGTSLDITEQKQAEQSLRDYAASLDFLSGTAQKMLEPLSRPEIFRYVTERIYALADGAVVLFNEFDFRRRKTILRELACTEAERAIATELFGGDPVGLTLDFPDTIRKRFIPGGFERVEGGLCELAFHQLPSALCTALERTLDIDAVYAMACSVEQDILGTVAILAHEGTPLRNQHLIESIVTQAALALQRRRTEEDLKAERNFVDAVLDTEGAIVAVLDTDYRIVRLNRAFAETAHTPVDSVLGQPFPGLMDSRSARRAEAQLDALIQGRGTDDYETLMTVRNAPARHVRWRNTALREETGALQYIIATGIDVTDRVVAEEHVLQLNRELQQRATELEHANRELECFSYTVTHDLRRPLRAMIGLGEILKEDYASRLDDCGRRTLNRIIEAGQRMNRMVDDILSLATVSRQELKTEPIDLSALAQAVLADLAQQQPDRRVETIVESTDSVEGDNGLLAIALANLLGNAWKYTLKTETAHIEFGSVHENGTQVFYVRDNGVGFDMQHADRLFRPFERLHTDEAFAGTGIGLATVARIIERHRGRVWAKAEEGKGATFYFTLWQR